MAFTMDLPKELEQRLDRQAKTLGVSRRDYIKLLISMAEKILTKINKE